MVMLTTWFELCKLIIVLTGSDAIGHEFHEKHDQTDM